MKRFHHSGKIGDILYSLPTIRALGGGELLLSVGTFTDFSQDNFEQVYPLLAIQDYLRAIKVHQKQEVDYDLDLFRCNATSLINLADCHLRAFGLPERERDSAWLRVHKPRHQYAQTVIFARSKTRVPAPRFWEVQYEEHRKSCTFIGLPSEHELFCQEIGPIPHCKVSNFLEMAEVIAGCALFVGNQSAPYAVAEGLKKDSIQEVDRNEPNCIFLRPNARYVRVQP